MREEERKRGRNDGGLGGMIRCEGGEREGKEGRGDKTIGRARPLARPLDHDKNKTGSPRAGGKFCVLGEMYHRDGCLHDEITMGDVPFVRRFPRGERMKMRSDFAKPAAAHPDSG